MIKEYDIEELRFKIEILESKNDALDEENDSLKDLIDSLKDTIEILEKQVEHSRRKLAEIKANATKSIPALVAENAILQDRIEAAGALNVKYLEENKSLLSKLDNICRILGKDKYV